MPPTNPESFARRPMLYWEKKRETNAPPMIMAELRFEDGPCWKVGYGVLVN